MSRSALIVFVIWHCHCQNEETKSFQGSEINSQHWGKIFLQGSKISSVVEKYSSGDWKSLLLKMTFWESRISVVHQCPGCQKSALLKIIVPIMKSEKKIQYLLFLAVALMPQICANCVLMLFFPPFYNILRCLRSKKMSQKSLFIILSTQKWNVHLVKLSQT